MGVRIKPKSIAQAKRFMEKYMVYYDRGVIVCNKPTDMTCQMSYGTSAKYMKFNILCKGIQHHLNLLKPPHSVHRLDKNTTGALLLGRNHEWARNLSRQFVDHKIGKTYLALVYGREDQFPGSSGVIENKLGDVRGRVRFDPEGTPTKTEWELLGSSVPETANLASAVKTAYWPQTPAAVSFGELSQKSGRVCPLKFTSLNFRLAPVIGDDTYKEKHMHDLVKRSIMLPSRLMFLHAHEVSLERWTKFGYTPHSKFRQTFRVPVPTKFRVLCRDTKIPVDQAFLKSGAVLINGEPWTTPVRLYHEDEKCWISPKLLPGSDELPDEKDD